MTRKKTWKALARSSAAREGMSAARWLAATGLLLFSVVLAAAQNNTSDNLTSAGAFQTNNAALQPDMLISNVLAQMAELGVTNEFTTNDMAQIEQGPGQTNVPPDTNFEVQPQGGVPSGSRESRRQWLFRQRAGAPGPSEAAGANVQSAGSGNGPARPDYSNFKIVADRNIFDPNRTPHRPDNLPRPKTVESFGLVGIMSYEKGTFAFFDGTSSDYKKAVKPADTIAGYQVTSIEPETVKLAAGTNQVQLRVGMQLRRDEGSGWVQAAQSETYTPVSSNASPTSTSSAVAAAGADNDVLERLRKKREQE